MLSPVPVKLIDSRSGTFTTSRVIATGWRHSNPAVAATAHEKNQSPVSLEGNQRWPAFPITRRGWGERLLGQSQADAGPGQGWRRVTSFLLPKTLFCIWKVNNELQLERKYASERLSHMASLIFRSIKAAGKWFLSVRDSFFQDHTLFFLVFIFIIIIVIIVTVLRTDWTSGPGNASQAPYPWDIAFFTFYLGTGFHWVAKDGFELVTFLPQPPEMGLQGLCHQAWLSALISNLIMLISLFLWWSLPTPHPHPRGDQTQDCRCARQAFPSWVIFPSPK